MVAASKAQTRSRMAQQAAKPASTDSTLASLAGRATTASATAGRTEGLNTGNNFTGQYLFDRFMNDDADKAVDMSKMEVVRAMVKSLDTLSFKKVLADFVGIAKAQLDKATDEYKASGHYNADEPTPVIMVMNARLKTVRNHQTVLRIAYGALKHASAQLAELGAGTSTGYQVMRVVGAKALALAGINWDGTKAEPRDQREARLAQTAETQMMLKVQADMPKKQGEERAHYLDRILKETDKRMKAKAAEDHQAMLEAKVARVRDLLGDDFAEAIDLLLAEPEAPTPDAALH